MNQSFGSKKPSSGFCPPEMAKCLLRCNEANNDEEVAEILAEFRVLDESYDLWSFGIVLFHLGSGSSLWHCEEHSDNVARPDEMKMLAGWDEKIRLSNMRQLRGQKPEQKALYDLVEKLLEPRPEARMRHFPQGMTDVLEHPFLKGSTLDSETLKEMSNKQAIMNDKLDSLHDKLDEVLQRLSAHTQMMMSLLDGDHHVPGLVVIVPCVQTPGYGNSMWSMTSWLNPATWMTVKLAVFFVDPVRCLFSPSMRGRPACLAFFRPGSLSSLDWLRALSEPGFYPLGAPYPCY